MDECSPWAGRTNADGYGVLGNGRLVHRVAWEDEVGPIPAGLCVLHRCDNPPCRNVTHLFLGSRAANNADRAAKRRNANFKGERNPGAKLTESDVDVIRSLLSAGTSRAELGRRYGVSWSAIDDIAIGRTWARRS